MQLPIWFFILILPGIIGLVVGFFKKKEQAPWLIPVAIVCIIIGGAGWYVAPEVEFTTTEEATVSAGVTWGVSCVASDTNLITVNNDAKTINIMVFANTTGNALLYKDNTTGYSTAPSLAFTCRPLKVGSVDAEATDKAYTGRVSITDPGKVCDSGTSYLFSRATGKTSANLPWVSDGVTEYETNYITVNYGSSESANLTLNFNEAGIANTNAIDGEQYTFYIDVCGTSWTGTIGIVDAFTYA